MVGGGADRFQNAGRPLRIPEAPRHLFGEQLGRHCATGFDDGKYVRMMFRTTLEGEAPVMAA